MIPINDPKLMNAFHIEDLLREAKMERLAHEADRKQERSSSFMVATGDALINAGNWFKSHSGKHNQN